MDARRCDKLEQFSAWVSKASSLSAVCCAAVCCVSIAGESRAKPCKTGLVRVLRKTGLTLALLVTSSKSCCAVRQTGQATSGDVAMPPSGDVGM